MAELPGRAFVPLAGWLRHRVPCGVSGGGAAAAAAVEAEVSWQRCWCVVNASSLCCYEDEDCGRLVAEYAVGNSTSAVLAEHPAVPADMKRGLEGLDHTFFICRLMDSYEDEFSRWAGFAAGSGEAQQAWLQAVETAVLSPRHFEAYIDDFSDVEDTEHVRKSSFSNLDELDWSQAESKRPPAESTASSEAPREYGHLEMTRLASSEQDDDCVSRSSLEMTHDIDWNAVAGVVDEKGADSEGDGEDIDDRLRCETAFLPDDVQVKGAFDRVYGECY